LDIYAVSGKNTALDITFTVKVTEGILNIQFVPKIAGVSCAPTTAKVAQKCVFAVAPRVIILPEALGANIAGVITTAILAGIYITLFQR
jgi:Na+-transporting methylmalonyl-CoA/oxaloacetate decarboxylase beta subunit